MGRIGQAVATLLRAFGASGNYYDPFVALPEERERELGFSKKEFGEVLRSSDILTLHLPGAEGNRRCIDERAIGLLPEKAIVINAARGGLIDEGALVRALRSGKLGGAGLDCFEGEPLGRESPLLAFPNVALTPHIAAGTRDAFVEKWRFVFRNVQGFLRTGELESEVRL